MFWLVGFQWFRFYGIDVTEIFHMGKMKDVVYSGSLTRNINRQVSGIYKLKYERGWSWILRRVVGKVFFVLNRILFYKEYSVSNRKQRLDDTSVIKLILICEKINIIYLRPLAPLVQLYFNYHFRIVVPIKQWTGCFLHFIWLWDVGENFCNFEWGQKSKMLCYESRDQPLISMLSRPTDLLNSP